MAFSNYCVIVQLITRFVFMICITINAFVYY